MKKQDKEKIIQDYLKTLTETEKNALKFASEHLESSFDIEKSNGFKEFISKINNTKN